MKRGSRNKDNYSPRSEPTNSRSDTWDSSRINQTDIDKVTEAMRHEMERQYWEGDRR